MEKPPPPPPPPAAAGQRSIPKPCTTAGQGAKLVAGDTSRPAFCMLLQYDCKDDRAFKVAEGTLKAVVNAVVTDDRKGVVVYAFARGAGKDASNRVYMYEIFADATAAQTHLTELEGEALGEMFSEDPETKILFPVSTACINPPENEDGVMAGLSFTLGAKALRATAGLVLSPSALNSKWLERYPDMRPKEGAGLILELRIEPKGGNKAGVVKALKSIVDSVESTDHSTLLSCTVSDAWWPIEAPFSKNAMGLNYVSTGSAGLTHQFRRSVLSALRAVSDAVHLVVTSDPKGCSASAEEELETLIEHFTDSGVELAERRSLFAGFFMHPAFTQEGVQRAKDKEEARRQMENDVKEDVALDAKGGGGERVLFDPAARGHGGGGGVPFAAVDAAQSVLNAGGGCGAARAPHAEARQDGAQRHGDPSGHGVLPSHALRVLQEDAKVMNLAAEGADLEDETTPEGEAVARLIESLSGLGYGMPPTGRVPVRFAGLEFLISALETEFHALVQGGRAAVADNAPIAYMALQELYPVGAIVTSTMVGGIGGTLVALRIADAHYEPLRSLFGGRKYSYHIMLETVVAMAGEFVGVRFEHIFEEWTGGKEIGILPYKILHPSDTSILKDLEARADKLGKLGGGEHHYRRYPAGCFFPKVNASSMGGSSSRDRQSAGGRLIVDTRRGLELGHAPVNMSDDLGIAIAMETKKLRQIQRALTSSDSERQRQERVQASGLRLWQKLPPSMRLLCWPTVVAFSLTLKQWGFVLVDSLEPVPVSSDAWDQLVLPERTKEMLLAMSSSTMRGEPNRYRFRDVVDEKGGGVLFLLYGPPGTGKTLSVEALASSFGRPLYPISFAELGSTVAELEERLTDVLALAAHWGALVLLDEGDALVEKRQRGQLLLNSMTGVLLRLLETFDGALFITSNRASSFDPAALSRVTLAVRYHPLSADATQLEAASLPAPGQTRSKEEALAMVAASFDLTQLAAFSGSGRNVGAVIRLAVGLCQQRGSCQLDQGILGDAIGVFQEFNDHLKEEGAEFG
eukprot:CAMPEP_0180223982 /NCGR_PEP_ID=MMETSP0987-20121128/21777_1 /TAXON_ID=697907 /ORGANISM="non described non described, Strain CCMP2293" /LENGTH=1030 /DNA_ID=CAMNT_0022186659 /DNA_START=27 /DNA_END=3119 /DNA_ORIENTATION=-